jgi:hypothetical protein
MAKFMKDNYDFSKGVRGKFYREDAIHVPPIFLDTDVLATLVPLAEQQGTSLQGLVNKLLKHGNRMKVCNPIKRGHSE